MNYHDELGRCESFIPAPLVCCDCGCEAQGNYGCKDGNVCDACVKADEEAANNESK